MSGTSWAPLPRRRVNKYGAVRVRVGGRTFASKREAKRYQELRLLQEAGEIEDLALQVGFPCVVGGMKVCTYVADFVYLDLNTGDQVVEDAKGMKTPVYRLKKKLVRACLGIEIQEV